MPPGDVDSAALSLQIGQLTGVMQASHQATMTQLSQIREDMHRMEDNHRKELSLIEERLTKRVDGLENRFDKVEKNQNEMAVAAAKQSVITGGLSGSFTYLAIELIKNLAKHF